METLRKREVGKVIKLLQNCRIQQIKSTNQWCSLRDTQVYDKYIITSKGSELPRN